jgi:3-oxoacid CoA-transferase
MAMSQVQTKSGSKVCQDAQQALADVPDGARIMFGGFGLCGIPENMIAELGRKGTRQLTVISNNCGNAGRGLALLLKNRQVRKCICSFVGGNPDLEEQILSKQVEVELTPQGTLAERIRAKGAGIPAFFTPTGVGTPIAEGKVSQQFNGRTYLLETAIEADYAMIRAYKGDTEGNLIFRRSARNFSPMMAMAARTTIAEVEHLVEPGELDADEVHLPGIFVQRIFQGARFDNPLEKVTLAQTDGGGAASLAPAAKPLSRRQMAWRAAQILPDGGYVNLGIGVPTLVADYLPRQRGIRLHSENGVLGVGPYPTEEQVEYYLINAGKETITLNPGAAIFDSSTSFAMIRGGHLDWAILGALQVSQAGDLANWMIPGEKVNGMGGAMDLAAGAKNTMVLTTHTDKKGNPKLVASCAFPLTAPRTVNKVVSDLAVITIDQDGFLVEEMLEGMSRQELQARTGAPLRFAAGCKPLMVPAV